MNLFRFLPLWVGARGIEFDWKYIQMSLDSNIALVRFYEENTYQYIHDQVSG